MISRRRWRSSCLKIPSEMNIYIRYQWKSGVGDVLWTILAAMFVSVRSSSWAWGRFAVSIHQFCYWMWMQSPYKNLLYNIPVLCFFLSYHHHQLYLMDGCSNPCSRVWVIIPIIKLLSLALTFSRGEQGEPRFSAGPGWLIDWLSKCLSDSVLQWVIIIISHSIIIYFFQPCVKKIK